MATKLAGCGRFLIVRREYSSIRSLAVTLTRLDALSFSSAYSVLNCRAGSKGQRTYYPVRVGYRQAGGMFTNEKRMDQKPPDWLVGNC